MIFIASDHGGFDLKNKIVKHFEEKYHGAVSILDLGPSALNPEDDYPLYVKPVIEKVLEDPVNKGILICKNGVGVCMVANKAEGIRAGLSWNTKHAASSRNDDDTNILCLPADYISEKDAIETVEVWLKTEFGNKERYVRRLAEGNL